MAFADALRVQYTVFGRRVLSMTNPWARAMLFADDPAAAFSRLATKVPARVGKAMNRSVGREVADA